MNCYKGSVAHLIVIRTKYFVTYNWLKNELPSYDSNDDAFQIDSRHPLEGLQ